MSTEDLVFSYWQARSERHDRELQELALDGIRPRVEQITGAIGYLWGPELERLLITSCLNYSRQTGTPFLTFFIRQMQAAFNLTYEQEERMLQAVNT